MTAIAETRDTIEARGRRTGGLVAWSPLPGLPLALGIALTALSLIVVGPLAVLVVKAASVGPEGFIAILTSPRILAALKLSFGDAALAALIDLPIGLLIAWVLVRYEFPGKRLIDAAVDLPFALPTAVAGIALTALYAPKGWIGQHLEPLGLKVAYTPVGVIVALVFVGLPFIVRTIQPVLEETPRDIEEAAALLGASRWQTVTRVVLPLTAPAAVTGFGLAFARAVGEYGSVIFIAGNLPHVSEITPLLIVVRLEQYDYAGAAAIAVVMLAVAFALLFVLNLLSARLRRRLGDV
jgi:sulfate transport system permease protein